MIGWQQANAGCRFIDEDMTAHVFVFAGHTFRHRDFSSGFFGKDMVKGQR